MERGWRSTPDPQGTVHRLMQPGRPGRGVTPCPKAHNYRACCRPGRAPRPDRKGRLHSRCSSPETCGRHHPHVPHPGRIRVPGRPRQGPLCPQEGLLATPTAGTHANRPASTTPRRSGGSELPAHQGCDDIFHVEPWEHKCTSADYTTTMNKYGIHCLGGKNRYLPRTAPQQISFNATRRKELANQQDLPHQKKSNQRRDTTD